MNIKQDIFKLPNLLSLSRLLLSPLVFYLLTIPGLPGKIISLGFLCLIFSTDYFDGYFARKLSLQSDLGRILDPLADKVLILQLLLALIIYRDLNPIVLYAVLIRDIIILSGGLYLTITKKIVLESNVWGKAATAFLMAAALFFILDELWYLALGCLIAGLIMVIVSFILYVISFFKILK